MLTELTAELVLLDLQVEHVETKALTLELILYLTFVSSLFRVPPPGALQPLRCSDHSKWPLDGSKEKHG